MATSQGMRRVLYREGFEDQVPIPCNEQVQGRQLIGEERTIGREFDNRLISRRDGILRGIEVAIGMVGTTTILNPIPATAFFDYEGETTDYTYRPPTTQEAGIAPTTTQESSSSSSAESHHPSADDERSPGLLDNTLLQSTSHSRVKEYQRLEECGDEWVDPLLTEDSFDGMYF